MQPSPGELARKPPATYREPVARAVGGTTMRLRDASYKDTVSL